MEPVEPCTGVVALVHAVAVADGADNVVGGSVGLLPADCIVVAELAALDIHPAGGESEVSRQVVAPTDWADNSSVVEPLACCVVMAGLEVAEEDGPVVYENLEAHFSEQLHLVKVFDVVEHWDCEVQDLYST